MTYSEYIEKVKIENKDLIESMINAKDETFEDFRAYMKMNKELRLSAAKIYREAGELSDDDRIITTNKGITGKMYSFPFMDFSHSVTRDLAGRAWVDLKSRNA